MNRICFKTRKREEFDLTSGAEGLSITMQNEKEKKAALKIPYAELSGNPDCMNISDIMDVLRTKAESYFIGVDVNAFSYDNITSLMLNDIAHKNIVKFNAEKNS